MNDKFIILFTVLSICVIQSANSKPLSSDQEERLVEFLEKYIKENDLINQSNEEQTFINSNEAYLAEEPLSVIQEKRSNNNFKGKAYKKKLPNIRLG